MPLSYAGIAPDDAPIRAVHVSQILDLLTGVMNDQLVTLQNGLIVNFGITGTLTGNSSSATKLATARAINGVNFDGTAAITVPAAAGTLTGATLASNILASSLTSTGILASTHLTSPVVDSGGITVSGISPFASTIRVQGGGTPVSGAGVEVQYNTPIGSIIAYDRTGAAYKNLSLNDTLTIVGGNGASTFGGTLVVGSTSAISATRTFQVHQGTNANFGILVKQNLADGIALESVNDAANALLGLELRGSAIYMQAASGVTITGNVGIGGAPNTAFNLRMTGATTGATQSSVSIATSFDGTASTLIAGISGSMTFGGSPTVTDAAFIQTPVTWNRGTATLTNTYGLLVQNQNVTATNNYGIYINTPSGGSGINAGVVSTTATNSTMPGYFGGGGAAAPTGFAVGGALVVGNAHNSSQATLVHIDVAGGTDSKYWAWNVTSNALGLATYTDAGAVTEFAFQVIRSGALVSNVNLATNTGIFGLGSGVTVGSAPTGGDKGAGTINVSGNIYLNGTAYTNPDYVLEKWATGNIVQFADRPNAANYVVPSIQDTEAYIKTNLALPGFGQTAGLGLFDGGDNLLARLEEAYIHIIELNDRLQKLEN